MEELDPFPVSKQPVEVRFFFKCPSTVVIGSSYGFGRSLVNSSVQVGSSYGFGRSLVNSSVQIGSSYGFGRSLVNSSVQVGSSYGFGRSLVNSSVQSHLLSRCKPFSVPSAQVSTKVNIFIIV